MRDKCKMDLWHYFGNDLSVNNTGDILTSSSTTLTKQRILRRLLTNQGDYLWDLTYGAGLPQYIGRALTLALYQEISGIITAQLYLEPTVSQSPPPVIKLRAEQNSFFVNITFTDAQGQLQVLAFTVS